MKNFLIYCLFITLSIIVNSCEEGYKDESTQYSLVLEEVTPVPSLTTDSTPNYTFSSNIAGNITYGGSCSSSTTTVIQGNNTITLDSLSDGTYSDCTITVDTTNSWLINSLTMSSFTIDTTAETLLEVTAVTTPTNDNTPNYTFSTNEAGTITYGGSCSSSATSAFSGDNTITFNSLSDGTYSDCTITVTTSSANSITLNISSFVIDTTAPTVTQETAVTTPTNDTTPNYTFSTNEAGTITYGGSCSSRTTTVRQGNNTITLDPLSDGTYSDCTITVDTTNRWLINSLTMSSFTIDTTAETLSEVTAVTTPTNDTTPNYTFSTNEAGTITYGGSCSSSTTSATSGNNTITFISLSEGTYSDCTIIVKDSAGNASNTLAITSFEVLPSYVAVGYSGTILTSSDGTTWTKVTATYTSDNGSTETPSFNDVTYGNGTFVAVNPNGIILTSTDVTSSWTKRTSGQ